VRELVLIGGLVLPIWGMVERALVKQHRPADRRMHVLRLHTTGSHAFSVLCCAVLCCAVLCCAVLCCAVLCCAVLCCAVCLACCWSTMGASILFISPDDTHCGSVSSRGGAL